MTGLTGSVTMSSAGVRECSEAGIQFLMLDTYNQLWLLLKQYTEAAAVRSGKAKGCKEGYKYSF